MTEQLKTKNVYPSICKPLSKSKSCGIWVERLLWNGHKSIICFSRILKKNFMNNAAEMMENIHMIYSQVTKGQYSTIIVRSTFDKVWRSKKSLCKNFPTKKWKIWKDFIYKLSKTRQNVLQTDKIVIKFSIGSVGWLNQLDEDQINQSRHIYLVTYTFKITHFHCVSLFSC